MTFPGVLLSRLSVQVALGVGAGGVLLDVSSYVRAESAVTRDWGRDDSFFDIEPGTFSFELDNQDGRFTPGNVASPLSTLLTEGLSACLQVETRLVAGRVRRIEPVFRGDNADWAAVRITCDDMLGQAARTRLLPAWDALVNSAGMLGLWKFDEPAGATEAADSGPNSLPSFTAAPQFGYTPTFGLESIEGFTDTQALGGGSGSLNSQFVTQMSGLDFRYPTNEAGAYGFWWTPITPSGGATEYFGFRVALRGGSYFRVTAGFNSGDQLGVAVNDPFFIAPAAAVPLGTPVYVAVVPDVVGSDLRVRLYIDGVLAATDTDPLIGTNTSANLSPARITLSMRSSVASSSFRLSRISHTLNPVDESQLVPASTTEAGLLELVEQVTPGVTFDTLPAALSDVLAVRPDFEDASALDLINMVVRSQQGYVYPVTTGTLTNPTEVVTVRERVRSRTVDYEFNVESELSGAPEFVRDLTNAVSEARVSNGDSSTTVLDRSLIDRFGNASDSDTVVLERVFDMRAWGFDRLTRGANDALSVTSVVVDAMTTPTDRSADLLALTPGDVVRLTGLPGDVLGFTTWDGWFIGGRERHGADAHEFTLYLTPMLNSIGIYGDSLYMAGDEFTLAADISNSATSISVASSSLARLTTTEVPFTVQIAREQMTVTACTGATPQVLTVTRGVNGTPALAHLAGDGLSVVPSSTYAF